MHFQILNINMLYLSKISFLNALTPMFLVPRPSTIFTDKTIISTRTHTVGVYSDIYIIHNGLAILRGQNLEFRYFLRFSEYFGCLNSYCVDKCWGRRFFVGHIKAVGCKSGPPSWAPPSPEQFPPP